MEKRRFASREPNYTAVVERCPDTRLYVGYVPGLSGAHSQAETLEELNANLREVLSLIVEDGPSPSRADQGNVPSGRFRADSTNRPNQGSRS